MAGSRDDDATDDSRIAGDEGNSSKCVELFRPFGTLFKCSSSGQLGQNQSPVGGSGREGVKQYECHPDVH